MRAGGLTRLLAKPWIDPLCLKGMEWILPASRCWAAAGRGDPAFFSRDLGLGHIPAGIAHRVRQTGALRLRAGEAQESWIAAAFGGTGNLTAAEHARREAAHIYLSQRFGFLWFARWRNVPAVKLDVPSTAELAALVARGDPAAYFALPADPVTIETSAIIAHDDVREYWLRFPSPDEPGDTCWVHVYEGHGKDGAPLPTLIFGHGLAMETEMMRGDMRGYRGLAAAGCRVLLPDAPGHNRRVTPGLYGGESFMCRPPLSGLAHFRQAARELGAIIAWCHGAHGGKVALGGISLGALTAQVTAQHMAHWPQAARPDALLLLTTTDRISTLTFTSSLATATGLGEAARSAGWGEREIGQLARFTDSAGPAPLDPANIVLMIGRRDDVTPYDGGRRLAENWKIPADNLFVRNQGHFSAAIGLGADPAPFTRTIALLKRQFGG